MLSGGPKINTLSYLKRLNLAEYRQETKPELEVDLLIGFDFMWVLMITEVVKGESEQNPCCNWNIFLVGFFQNQFLISPEAYSQV